jgi:hypothetical protein
MRIRDPGWRQFGSGIRDGKKSDPGSSSRIRHTGPRAVDPHCFDADPEPDPAQNLDMDPDPDPDPGGGGGEGVGQQKMCIPPGKILGTPLHDDVAF